MLWLGVAAVGFVLFATGLANRSLALAAFPVLAIASAAVSWRLSRLWRRTPLDYPAAAAVVEAGHPELRQALRTALELRPGPGGRYPFLQQRVLDEVLAHALRHDWKRQPRGLRPWPNLAHAATAAAVVVLLAVTSRAPLDARRGLSEPAAGSVAVTPGDTEVERGTTVVIAARFGGEPPASATLVHGRPGEEPQRTPMARSLSDPVFAVTLPALAHDVVYRVEHAGRATADYHVSVFDLPALVRADADLD